nr:hypothetical protein [Tanacetum cinerariifolium]
MASLTFADTHNMVVFLSKSDASKGFDQIVDFLNAHNIKYALVVNPTIHVSCIKQFWAMATVKKVNDDVQVRALIDGKKVVVLEAIIRRDLHFDDVDGVECLPNNEIFKELARMGYEKPPLKLTFYKATNDLEQIFKTSAAAPTLSSSSDVEPAAESFKKLRAAEVSGSESTQEIPSNNPKEMTEKDVQNMLEIIPVSEFKVEALQVKYPIID